MKVKLIAYTQVNHDLGMSTQDFIAYCARVSNPDNQNNTGTAPKLLKYLIKNKHWSVFEMSNVVMDIETTRDIARQILRHRSFSFQEFSQRYADPTQMEFQFREARLQDTKNRQNSIETDNFELKNGWDTLQSEVINHATNVYKWAIDNDIAKEIARAVLPEGLTSSKIYMSGSLRSWIHYIEVRNHPATQLEHRQIAIEVTKNICDLYPALKETIDEMIAKNYEPKK